ncbi:MAG: 2OG-Fe(II) oxygenase [Alphaproteobacteria bacterium]
MLTVGDPAPWFVAPSSVNPRFDFSQAAGRHIALCFFGSGGNPEIARMIKTLHEPANLLDDGRISFFGVSNDPADENREATKARVPGIRFFWDFNHEVAKLYDVAERLTGPNGATPVTFLLDPFLRVLGVLRDLSPANHAKALMAAVIALPTPAKPEPAPQVAPVLVIPRVLEPSFCRELIKLYDTNGGEDSGFMRNDNDGRTYGMIDYRFKRRRDYNIEDETVRRALAARIKQRLIPEIHKAFQFQVTRIERYIVACYNSNEGGYFKAHRDNTTKGTAHRRFAVTMNLNAEEYEGGDLMFPEFGTRTYRAPTGGAAVFSCSLLHEATPIRSGKRYCTLPFLYDDAAAKVREANLKFMAPTDEWKNANKGDTDGISKPALDIFMPPPVISG